MNLTALVYRQPDSVKGETLTMMQQHPLMKKTLATTAGEPDQRTVRKAPKASVPVSIAIPTGSRLLLSSVVDHYAGHSDRSRSSNSKASSGKSGGVSEKRKKKKAGKSRKTREEKMTLMAKSQSQILMDKRKEEALKEEATDPLPLSDLASVLLQVIATTSPAAAKR